jgi:hypothetical protein
LWLSALVEVICFVIYTQLVVLQAPASLDELASGLYHGPSQLLTFALPLVDPRSLMVAPVALTWLAGAIGGECIARGWTTMVTYAGFLVAYGLAYAATVRAAGGGASAQLRETVIAAALLLTLLLLRAVRSWSAQDADAEQTQPDGVLPLRGLAVGGLVAVLVAAAAGAFVQSSAFSKHAATPQRVPSVRQSHPLTPVSFVSGLRPTQPSEKPRPVFTVTTDRAAPGYFAIANVDYYDGAGWSFQRTFRPSGGVLPEDTDTSLNGGASVTQAYQVARGPLSSAPWMAYLYRPQQVTGIGVNIDPASGMVVPTRALRAGDSYTVHSTVASKAFGALGNSATPDATTPSIDIEVPPGLRSTLTQLISTFADETGTPSSRPIPFLQALQQAFRNSYGLSSNTSSPSTPTSSAPASASPSPSGASSTGPVRTGSTSFADVLASIVGPQRAGTPEQYATLIALVARQLGVPARVVTGFRVAPTSGKALLPAGTYQVDTADAWTWVEVPVVGAGWVVLDATPGRVAGPRQQASVGVTSSPVPTLTPTRNALITEGNAGHAAAKKSAVPGGHGTSNAVLLIALIVAGALLLALLVLLVVRKPLRANRRRNAADPRRRLAGAWEEGIDLLRESGLPDLKALTSAEIAFETARHFGTEPAAHADYLGSSANVAVYSTTAVIDAADAEAAWSAERELRRSLREQLSLPARLMAALRYHRPSGPPPLTGPASWREAEQASQQDRRRRGRRRRAH